MAQATQSGRELSPDVKLVWSPGGSRSEVAVAAAQAEAPFSPGKKVLLLWRQWGDFGQVTGAAWDVLSSFLNKEQWPASQQLMM